MFDLCAANLLNPVAEALFWLLAELELPWLIFVRKTGRTGIFKGIGVEDDEWLGFDVVDPSAVFRLEHEELALSSDIFRASSMVRKWVLTFGGNARSVYALINNLAGREYKSTSTDEQSLELLL